MIDLKKLKALEEFATPGPWWNESCVIHAKGPKWTEENHSCIHPVTTATEEDAVFISEVRNALPDLLSRISLDERVKWDLARHLVDIREKRDAYIKRLEDAYLESETHWNKESSVWYDDVTWDEFVKNQEEKACKSLERIRNETRHAST